MRQFKRTQRCYPGNDAATNVASRGDQRCRSGMQQLEADDHAALLVARHREQSFLFQEQLYHVLLVEVSSWGGGGCGQQRKAAQLVETFVSVTAARLVALLETARVKSP